MLRLAEDDCADAEGAPSRSLQSGLDFYLRLRRLQLWCACETWPPQFRRCKSGPTCVFRSIELPGPRRRLVRARAHAVRDPVRPMPERFDRFESAVHVIRAMFSDAAATEAGVTRPDPFYPLDGATNDPPPLHARRSADLAGRPEAPRDRPRRRGGPGLAAPRRRSPTRHRPTWPTSASGTTSSSARWRRSAATRRASRSSPRCPPAGPPRPGGSALDAAHVAVGLGATHVIVGIAPSLGPAAVDAAAAEVAEPLRQAYG